MPGSIPGSPTKTPFDILAVGQRGRLQAEALLLAASWRAASPGFPGRLVIAEPQPGPLWLADPRMSPRARDALRDLGATVLPFESHHFGLSYPHGNKIEALALLDGPFLFLDTDMLVLGDLAGLPTSRPSASMRREGTWPVANAQSAGPAATWAALYDRFGLDLASSLDPRHPEGDWRRFLYFNAGWFTGPDARAFHDAYLRTALSIRDEPLPETAPQPLDPWLDQAALPLVIHGLGGGRPGPDLAGLDGALTCHYRTFALLYAREPDAVVAMLERLADTPLLRAHEPLRRAVFEGEGARARALFDRTDLPAQDATIRQRLKAEGLWVR